MFTQVTSQEVTNENGITVEIDGYVLRYRDRGHVMEFGAQPCPPLSPQYDVLFNITFPTELQWMPPHQGEPVSAEQSQKIERHIIEALSALKCQVDFTIPMVG